MIFAILIISICFGILLHETNYLRIRLPYGKNPDNGIKLLNAGKVETIYLLPIAKKQSYFMPCELSENPDVVSTNVVKIRARIL